MPSSYSTNLRFELQFTGENINVWGIHLNNVISKIDYSIAGWLDLPVTTNVVLTTSNLSDDQARVAMIRTTGAGGFSVTIPGVSKSYIVRNECTALVIITTGSGDTVQVDPGDTVQVICDGTDVLQLGYNEQGLKAYIAAAALGATGSLPATTGNAGKYVYTDGATSTWKTVVLADLSDWAAKEIALKALAIAHAINL